MCLVLWIVAAGFTLLWYECSYFFFQAEDGIRYAQESRGLGDVYKRQAHGLEIITPASAGAGIYQHAGMTAAEFIPIGLVSLNVPDLGDSLPVSYTHLTLPTIYSV